jgi:hypothetical protein
MTNRLDIRKFKKGGGLKKPGKIGIGLIDEKKAWSGELYGDLQTNYTDVIGDGRFDELVDETYELCFSINRRPSNLLRRIPLR